MLTVNAESNELSPKPIFGQGVFISEQRFNVLREPIANKTEPQYSAFLALERQVKQAITEPAQPLANWYVPPFYKDSKGHGEAKAGMARDANNAYSMAVYYRLTDDEKWAQAAAKNIDAWVAGVETLSREADSALSFSYHFPAFIFAADLLKNSQSWPAANQNNFRNFVREKALPMNTMERHNNWGNWGLVLVMASAAYLQDEALFEKGVGRWKEFIESQIADDGHFPEEVTRNGGVGERGIWYSHFTLMPQTIAAEIALINGVVLYDYSSPSGHTLRKAFERLAPWAHDPSTFPYFKVPPDKQGEVTQLSSNYISYFEILNVRWPQSDAKIMLSQNRPLTALHSTPHLTLTHGEMPFKLKKLTP